MTFDPLSRALLDALRSLDERIAAIEARLGTDEQDDYLTVAQAATLRNCTPHALRARVRRGHISHIREGTRIYIKRSDVT